MNSGKQIQQRLASYIREVEDHMPAMPKADRDAQLRRLKDRISLDLSRFKDGPTVAEFEGVLAEYGDPDEAAEKLSRNGASKPAGFLAWKNRVWLGVCGGIAKHFEVNPAFVRGVAVLLCLIPYLIPFLLLGYLGTFFYCYFSGEREVVGPIQPLDAAVAAGIAFAVGLALHFSAKLVVWVIAKSYAMVSGQGFSVDPRWNWIVYDSRGLLFWALAICIPLAVISGMPVAKGWQGTLRKVYQAGLALYGVALCYGIAGVIVHLALRLAKNATAGGEADSLMSLIDQITAMTQ